MKNFSVILDFYFRSPTHAGGLFAMDRKYFFEMGAYDEGMQIWGGENFELSFKVSSYKVFNKMQCFCNGIHIR